MNNTELRTFSIGLLILLLSGAACASATTVSITDATVEPGDVITLPIMIGNITDYGTGTINIEYDPSVAHITNVTDGPESQIAAHDVNNTLGLAWISASNPYGVSGDIIFANVTFKAIGSGSTPLNLNVTLLGDISYDEIPATVSDGSIKVEASQPPKPFFIHGYVCYENGTPCNNPSVNITNLNTYEEWQIETSGGSNYYQISLSSGIDLSATDVLRFDATDGTSTNVTDHTVTQAEVGAGGFECNITLGTAESDTTAPIITNIANGTPTDSSVTITWDTDEASDSLVEYGITSGTYTDSEPNATMVTSHSIDLSGLSAGTTYYFVVNSTDTSSNSNESEEHSFTTAAESINPPELVSCVITPTPPVVQGTNISIDCLFSEDVDYEIRIENATGVLIEMIGSGTATDPAPKWWNTTGTPAETYIVNVTMYNSTSGLSSYNDTNIIEVISAAEMSTVSIGSAEGSVGDSVNVSINITDAPSIGAMDIRVAYNASILGATNVMNGSMIESLPAPLVAYHLGYVDVNISFVTYPEAVNGDGELFIVTFDVVGGNAGDSSPLNLEAEAYTTDLSPVVLETVDGVVTVIDGAPDPAPSLVTYTISNTTISPDGDGIMDDTEIDVEFSEPVDAAIRIEDATGVIKTLYTGSGVTDPDPQTWDGTDDGGNIVTDGTYQVNVTMDDGVNLVVYDNTRSIPVMVDTITSVSIADVAAIGRITVPITIENVSNVGSCQLTLSYDPNVVIALDASSDFDSLFANFEDAASGSVNIIAYQTSNPGLTGDVLFADVTFVAVGAIESSTPLNLEVTTLTDATPECNPIPYTVRNGSFTMFLNGDVNGDSKVDVADCMYLAKHLLGVSGFETIVTDAADVNGNGEIEVSDCMYLAKHLAGMDGFEVLK